MYFSNEMYLLLFMQCMNKIGNYELIFLYIYVVFHTSASQ
jgi:hypothetical protein